MSVTTDPESLLCRGPEATGRLAKLRTGQRDGRTWRMLRMDVGGSSLATTGNSGKAAQGLLRVEEVIVMHLWHY